MRGMTHDLDDVPGLPGDTPHIDRSSRQTLGDRHDRHGRHLMFTRFLPIPPSLPRATTRPLPLARGLSARCTTLGMTRFLGRCGWQTMLFVAASAWLGDSGTAQVVLPPGLGQPAGGQTAPGQGYDLALEALASGGFTSALEIALRDYQTGVRIGANRWIDSIAAATVVGECRRELGGLREALAAYDEALLIAAANPDWLLAVQFPAQDPAPMATNRVATWGRSSRTSVPAAFPAVVTIRRGGGDPQEVLKRGGVLAGAADYPVRPHEIMRAIVIAAYRHGEILGGLGRFSPAVETATQMLGRRPAPANHYSQAWIDIALGTAQWARGRPELAQPLLVRGLTVGRTLDHPLTAWGLIVLGRIALDSDQAPAAVRLFEDATIVAADYGDVRALEEAFRLAFAAHMAAGTRGVPASIRGGCAWATSGPAVLRASLLAMQAESSVTAGDLRTARASLQEIDARLLRGDPGRGDVGARAAHAAAAIAYVSGDTATGDAELGRAIEIIRPRTPRLFQLGALTESLQAGSAGVSDREAESLFSTLLGEPTARDTAVDPLGMLATTTAPREAAFEAWVTVAGRRGDEPRLTAGEAFTRARWLGTQPLAGRRLAADRLLAADPAELSAQSAARRRAILGRNRDLAAMLDQINEVRGRLVAGLTAAAAQGGAPAALPGRPEDWTSLRALAARQSAAAAAIAAGREHVPLDVPPLETTAEIRRRLAPRQLILSFQWTSSGLVGWLESRDRAASWNVRQAAALPGGIAQLAKALCLFDPVAPVPIERLIESDWKAEAERIERQLFENSKVTLAEGIDELVIVPDGWLWYVPFEILPVSSNRPDDATRRLRDVCRIRYAPTRSLAVSAPRAIRNAGPDGIVAGKMCRGDAQADIDAAAAALRQTVEHSLLLDLDPSGPAAALVGSLCDGLVIHEELTGAGPMATRPCILGGAGGGATFADWLAAPRKATRRIALPGFQTAMAGGLAAVPQRPGEDVFLPAMSLLAAGASTAVMSRWRVGGKVGLDLVAEFMADQATANADGARPPAAESWQRAVDLALAGQPDPTLEPRVRFAPRGSGKTLTDASHPFFWAGYMLVDRGTANAAQEPAPAAPPPAAAVPPGAGR